MLNFLIDTSKGETPASVARKRALVAQLMGQSSAPKNVGEGLNALGDGIVAAVMNRRADKAEAAGRGEGANAFASLFSGLGGVDTQAPEMAGKTAVSPGALPTQDYPSQRVSQAFGAASSDGGDVESYIRRAAAERGIDPEIAIRVARSEGGLKDPFRQSDIVKNGVREQSYGPFQLYMGGGLGNKALEAGIDPRKDWQGGINFALDQAATGGWGPWYGAKKIGVTGMTGIGQRPTGQVASLDPMAGMPDAQMTPEQIVQSFAQSRPQMSPPVDPAMNGMAPPNPSRFAPDAQPVVPGIPGQQTMPLGPQAQQPTGLAAAQPPQPAQMPPMGQPAPQPPMQVAQTGRGQFPPAPPPPQNSRVQQLMQVMTNPWLSDQERQVAGMMLQQEMQKMDPMRQLEMEKTRLELEAMRNPQGEQFTLGEGQVRYDAKGNPIARGAEKSAAKPTAIQEYEYAREQGFSGTFYDYEASKKGGMSLQVDPTTGAVTFQQGQNIKPMTEGQSKDTVYATRAEGALPLLDKFGEALTSLPQSLGSNIPGVGNYAKSPEYQQAEQAGNEFLQAILRKDTGAAITSDEMREYGETYLPRPGDSPEVLAQKRDSRQRAIAAINAGMTPQSILAKEKALSSMPKKGKAIIDGYTIEQVD